MHGYAVWVLIHAYPLKGSSVHSPTICIIILYPVVLTHRSEKQSSPLCCGVSLFICCLSSVSYCYVLLSKPERTRKACAFWWPLDNDSSISDSAFPLQKAPALIKILILRGKKRYNYATFLLIFLMPLSVVIIRNEKRKNKRSKTWAEIHMCISFPTYCLTMEDPCNKTNGQKHDYAPTYLLYEGPVLRAGVPNK